MTGAAGLSIIPVIGNKVLSSSTENSPAVKPDPSNIPSSRSLYSVSSLAIIDRLEKASNGNRCLPRFKAL